MFSDRMISLYLVYECIVIMLLLLHLRFTGSLTKLKDKYALYSDLLALYTDIVSQCKGFVERSARSTSDLHLTEWPTCHGVTYMWWSDLHATELVMP